MHEYDLELSMVGLRYRGFSNAKLKRIVQSVPLQCRLEREPKNEFDPNAIKVVSEKPELHLGYLRREVSAELAPLLDNGAQATCRLVFVNAFDNYEGELEVHLESEKRLVL